MSLLLLTMLAPLSFVIGIGASAIGVTAWMMLVPILFVLFGFDLYLTLFISLIVDCGNALIMTVYAYQNRQLELRAGLMFTAMAAVFVLIGIYFGTTFIPANKHMFKSSAAIVNLAFGLSFIRRGYKQGKRDRGEIEEVSPVVDGQPQSIRRLMIYPAVFFVGFQTGIFGIGGGMMYAIFLMICLSYPTLMATGTAMLMSFLTTLIAGTGIFFQIPADHMMDRRGIIFILTMVLFSMVGTLIGARIAYSLSLKKLNYLIATVIISAAVIAIVQNMLIST